MTKKIMEKQRQKYSKEFCELYYLNIWVQMYEKFNELFWNKKK